MSLTESGSTDDRSVGSSNSSNVEVYGATAAADAIPYESINDKDVVEVH